MMKKKRKNYQKASLQVESHRYELTEDRGIKMHFFHCSCVVSVSPKCQMMLCGKGEAGTPAPLFSQICITNTKLHPHFYQISGEYGMDCIVLT